MRIELARGEDTGKVFVLVDDAKPDMTGLRGTWRIDSAWDHTEDADKRAEFLDGRYNRGGRR